MTPALTAGCRVPFLATALPAASAAAFTEPVECPYDGAHPVLRPGSVGPALRHLHCLLGLRGQEPPPTTGPVARSSSRP